MKLEINSKASSGTRTKHFDIKIFYFYRFGKRRKVASEILPNQKHGHGFYDETISPIKILLIQKPDHGCMIATLQLVTRSMLGKIINLCWAK